MKKLLIGCPLLLLFIAGCCVQTVTWTFEFLYDPANPRIVSVSESEEMPTPTSAPVSGTMGEVAEIGGIYEEDYCVRKGTLDPANPFRGYPAMSPGYISGTFCMDGYVGSWEHEGVDVAYAAGTPVVALADVIIIQMGEHVNAGRFIDMCTGDSWCMRYMHLSSIPSGLREWDAVGYGTVVGYVGGTGTVTGVHLHYDIRHNDQFHDPYCTLADGLC